MTFLTQHIDDPGRLFAASASGFDDLALEIFRYQYHNTDIYRQYCNAIHIDPSAVKHPAKIPFLPIRFFKTHEVKTTAFDPSVIFESSGTTGTVNSRHFVKDTNIYRESFMTCFNSFYGDAGNYCIIGLLPSYLERNNSSLVWMVNELIRASHHPNSGFYLYDFEKLQQTLLENEQRQQQTILIGVTYALIDFFTAYPMKLLNTIIMETGGMKGRKEELTRSEVHSILMEFAGITEVHSEYGMTELLSQAYAKKEGRFACPQWMQVCIRAEDDPFAVTLASGIRDRFTAGAINVIDLANIYSCSFIATDDLCRLYSDGSFEVLGRLDNSDVRGCSLMIAT